MSNAHCFDSQYFEIIRFTGRIVKNRFASQLNRYQVNIKKTILDFTMLNNNNEIARLIYIRCVECGLLDLFNMYMELKVWNMQLQFAFCLHMVGHTDYYISFIQN